jgi:hypothetical protein
VLDRQTSPTPKLPWTSLALLFITYATFGWLLYDWTNDRLIWLVVAVGVTLIGGVVTYPSRSISLGFAGFFKTDTRAFILIVLTSIISVFLLAWAKLFVDTVVLFTAGLLVSLDLKVSGWNKPVILLLIIIWQLLSMSAGLTAHYFSSHPLPNLPEYCYSVYWLRFLGR